MDFSGYSSVNFRARDAEMDEFVYVLCFSDTTRCVPFYVGQTKRFWGRMDDYYWAEFAAATDFRVGEAVRFLIRKGEILVRYKSCVNSREEERRLINEHGKENLINGLSPYDYKTADAGAERERVCKFLNELLFKTPADH